MIDTQIRASLWRRSRTEFNTSKNNIVDFYFLQQNHFPWRMRVFHCCRRLLLHNITRRTIGEQISIECFGFGRDDSFDIYVFNPFIENKKKSLWWCIKYTTVCFSSAISPSRSNFLPQQIVFVANDLYFVGNPSPYWSPMPRENHLQLWHYWQGDAITDGGWSKERWTPSDKGNIIQIKHYDQNSQLFMGKVRFSTNNNPGAPFASCGKAFASHWRRNHRRWEYYH